MTSKCDINVSISLFHTLTSDCYMYVHLIKCSVYRLKAVTTKTFSAGCKKKDVGSVGVQYTAPLFLVI